MAALTQRPQIGEEFLIAEAVLAYAVRVGVIMEDVPFTCQNAMKSNEEMECRNNQSELQAHSLNRS